MRLCTYGVSSYAAKLAAKRYQAAAGLLTANSCIFPAILPQPHPNIQLLVLRSVSIRFRVLRIED